MIDRELYVPRPWAIRGCRLGGSGASSGTCKHEPVVYPLIAGEVSSRCWAVWRRVGAVRPLERQRDALRYHRDRTAWPTLVVANHSPGIPRSPHRTAAPGNSGNKPAISTRQAAPDPMGAKDSSAAQAAPAAAPAAPAPGAPAPAYAGRIALGYEVSEVGTCRT